MRSFLLIALAALTTPLAAQIGHPPAESPYRDVFGRHALSFHAGTFLVPKDPVGILPKSGPIFGARYDTFIGGPAQLTARLNLAPSTRRVIDPLQPAATRNVGEKSVMTTMLDLGININLTGNKSWHGFVPSVLTTVGIISDFAAEDEGGYSFGTTFGFGAGLGLRYVPLDSRWEARADVHNLFAQSEYPSGFFRISDDGTAAAPPGTEQTSWRRYMSLSVGITYHIFR